MNLSQIFRNFQNCRHFGVRVRFKTRSCNGSWVLHQDRPCYSLHFDILFDVLAKILRELWLFQNLTFFVISWPSYLTFDLKKTIGFCIVVDYIFGHSLVMIGQKLRHVSRKMWQFHLNMNIEGLFWRHAVTSSVTSSTSKIFLSLILNGLYISNVKMNLSKILRNFKNGHHF